MMSTVCLEDECRYMYDDLNAKIKLVLDVSLLRMLHATPTHFITKDELSLCRASKTISIHLSTDTFQRHAMSGIKL